MYYFNMQHIPHFLVCVSLSLSLFFYTYSNLCTRSRVLSLSLSTIQKIWVRVLPGQVKTQILITDQSQNTVFFWNWLILRILHWAQLVFYKIHSLFWHQYHQIIG
uniref:Uncharacterized protein n=1 Tax=Cacopsylla melanoneura TaxID=428564 RepID=A0A8D8X190_9HEMI